VFRSNVIDAKRVGSQVCVNSAQHGETEGISWSQNDRYLLRCLNRHSFKATDDWRQAIDVG